MGGSERKRCVHSQRALGFPEVSSWGVSGAKFCSLPARILPPASGFGFLKETRFLPGAFYVGQTRFQQPRSALRLLRAETAPSQAQKLFGHLTGFCSKAGLAN